MTQDSRRITLITRDPKRTDRNWDNSPISPNRLILLDSFTVLSYSISTQMADLDVDVDRVILDRSASPADFLTLLASLPHSFTGDVILIREDDAGFLSATGRGGDRVLYALSPSDIRFYLETQGLVSRKAGAADAAPIPVAELRFRLRAVV